MKVAESLKIAGILILLLNPVLVMSNELDEQLATDQSVKCLKPLLEIIPRSRTGTYDNPVRDALNQDKIAYGSHMMAACPATAQTVCEKLPFTLVPAPKVLGGKDGMTALEVEWLSAHAQSGSSAIFVEVPTYDFPYTKNYRDAGALGFVVHGIKTENDASYFITQRLKIPLEGTSGVGPSHVTSYLSNVGRQIKNNNSSLVSVFSIDNFEAVQNLPKIAEVSGIDVIQLNIPALEAEARAKVAKTLRGRSSFKNLSTDAQTKLIDSNTAAMVSDARSALEAIPARQLHIKLGIEVADRAGVEGLHAKGYRFVTIKGNEYDAIQSAVTHFYDSAPKNLEIDATVIKPSTQYPKGNPAANPLQSAIHEQKMSYLGFLMGRDPIAVRGLTEAKETVGIWIDGEHPGRTPREVKSYIAAMKDPGAVPILRVPQYNVPLVDLKSYDRIGVKGFVAPSVMDAQAAAHFVKNVKSINPNATAIVMIENKQGLENLDQILKVPGIDAIWIGPYDLSVSLGASGPNDPLVTAAVSKIEAKVKARGIALGGAAPSRTAAYQMYDRGYRVVTMASDQEAIRGKINAFLQSGPKSP